MTEELLQVPCDLTKIESRRNRSLSLTFLSQEEVPSEIRSKIMALHEEFGYLCFMPGKKVDAFDLAQLEVPEKLAEEEKSMAQRLHSVLYILWKQEKDKGIPVPDTSDAYYRQIMEKLINFYKEKLT